MRIIENSLAPKSWRRRHWLIRIARARSCVVLSSQGGLAINQTETRKFAKLGYSTFAINVFEQLGYPEPTHIVSGSQIQAKTPDPEFTRVLTEGWRFLLSQPHVNKQRVAVCGYCMGGRIAIHFVAATPEVRAFVGYYPTVRRPDSPLDRSSAVTQGRSAVFDQSVRRGRCDHRVAGANRCGRPSENGQPSEGHFSHSEARLCGPRGAGVQCSHRRSFLAIGR